MKKRWQLAPSLEQSDKNHIIEIAKQLKCPELIAELLIRRELKDIDEINTFFDPTPEQMHDPFLFCDMQKAASRVIKAIENKEQITIYGDYDVDGTTSTSLLYLGLRKLGAKINYYIPHRMIDGYGISLSGVKGLKDNGTSLIISVDCGINGFDEVDEINALGMEIIITDHHNPKETLPKAYAIINPKVEGCGYPDKNLAGVGVAYKLLKAVYKLAEYDSIENIIKFIDLVAVGTIADIVPLVGENRVFASLGLKRLNKRHNIGLKALAEIAGLGKKRLNTADIVFSLAPRINAAGRMGSAMRTVELMICQSEEEAKNLSEIIEYENSKRQEYDHQTFDEACYIIEKKYKNLSKRHSIVVSSGRWHPGVIGIVASKLVEKYYKPTIMITFQECGENADCTESVGSASGRSISGFDLFQALTELQEDLISFGGHKYAAGLSISEGYVDRFENRFNNYAKQLITDEQLIPPIAIEQKLELYDINNNLLKWLAKFAPFGPGNMRTTFYSTAVSVCRYPFIVGKNHLKIQVMKDGYYLNLIGFNMGEYFNLIKKDSVIDIAYSLEFNEWQGKKTIQGKLKDLKLH